MLRILSDNKKLREAKIFLSVIPIRITPIYNKKINNFSLD